MTQPETAYITRFRKFRDSLQASAPDPLTYQKGLLKWGCNTSLGLDKVWESAIPDALKQKDMPALHTIFFHSVRTLLLPHGGTGCDHCSNFWHLLDAAATEGTEELRRVLPAALGRSSNGHPMSVNGINLLLCLLHGEHVPFDRDAAMAKAEKFTATKHPLWERAVVASLLALLRQDPEGFSASLNDVRLSFGKIKCAKYMRLQCLNAYGLAVLARDLLPGDAFRAVRLPEGPSFSVSYIQWRLEQTGLPHDLWFTFPPDLDFVNRALAHPLAVQRVFQPYLHDENPVLSPADRRNWYLDGEAMIQALLREL